MGKGLGDLQRRALGLLVEAGGVLGAPFILRALFGQVTPGSEGYNRANSALSRSLRALRGRGLVMSYKGVAVGGRGVVVVALTAEGVRKVREMGGRILKDI